MGKKVNKDKDWVVTNMRFIAFIDIMGFKDYVARHEHNQVYEMMVKLSKSKEIVDGAFSDEDDVFKDVIYTTSFSDSLIIFTKDDSVISLEALTVSVSFIFAEAIKESVPMKGAISHGNISVNKTQQIYFGQPIIDAYLLQEEVHYYGIVSHNSIDRYLTTLKSDEDVLKEFIDLKTPLKMGNINHNNLNWFEFLKDSEENSTVIKSTFHNSILRLKTMTSGRSRKYIDNTVEVFKLIYPD